MSKKHLRKLNIHVTGTHGFSCEVLIKKEIMNFNGVKDVSVNYATGDVRIMGTHLPSIESLDQSIRKYGYSVENSLEKETQKTPNIYMILGAILLIAMAFLVGFKGLNISPANFDMSGRVSYGIAFASGVLGFLPTQASSAKSTPSDLGVAQQKDPNVELVDGKQIVKMKISGFNYYPSVFTIEKGVPVEWQIDSTDAAGCAHVIMVPKLRISKYLPTQGITTISFMPTTEGILEFSCSMGMTTPGAKFIVVADADNTQTCDLSKGNCPK